MLRSVTSYIQFAPNTVLKIYLKVSVVLIKIVLIAFQFQSFWFNHICKITVKIERCLNESLSDAKLNFGVI